MSAILSPCGKFRYLLTRTVGTKPEDPHGPNRLVFVMLNPSTADATLDDPTIRRCKAFAIREGMNELAVVNLFAFRATRPRDLQERILVGADTQGMNRMHLYPTCRDTNAKVVVAWGASSFAKDQGAEFRSWAFGMRVDLWCLGHTQDGSPRHPLYVRGDTPLVKY